MAGATFNTLMLSSEQLNSKVYGRNSSYTPKFEVGRYTEGEDRGQRVIVPYVGTKSVLISLKAWGVTQNTMHNVTLWFSGCDIVTEDPHDINYFSCMYKKQMYWIKKLDRFKNPMQVRCTCANFFFVWAYANNKRGVLYGPPPRPFKKKTNRKPQNIRNIPGMCKHIYNAWKVLRDSGLTLN